MLELQFFNEIRRSELDLSSAAWTMTCKLYLITNCIVAHKLYNHWEIAVICFAPAMIVLMRAVQMHTFKKAFVKVKLNMQI